MTIPPLKRLLAFVLFCVTAVFLLMAYKAVQPRGPYIGASIVPVARDSTGQWRVLLGIDSHTGKWADFGGGREAEDALNPAVTACREFLEETGGALGDLTVDGCVRKVLDSPTTKNIVYEYKKGSRFVSFIVAVDYDPELPARFAQLLSDIEGGKMESPPHLEKTKIEWVPFDDVTNALGTCCADTTLSCDVGADRPFRRSTLGSFCLAEQLKHFAFYRDL
mgnify:CR=1 FL=1